MYILIFMLKIAIIVLFTYIFVQNIKKKDIKQYVDNEFFEEVLNKKYFDKLKLNFIKLDLPFNVYTVGFCLSIGILISITVYAISLVVFKIKTVALIIALPEVFTMFFIIFMLATRKQEKLETVMNDFFIQLKGALKVNSDITEGLKRIQDSCISPFKEYIKVYLNEVSSGELPEIALYNLAKKVDVERFTLFVNNLRYCSVYGGDVENLTHETQKMISDILVQKKKRIKETKSICFVLYCLIFIDIIIYFNFATSNIEYLNLMRDTATGNLIVNMNFICIWFVLWLSSVVKKLDF
ncbi:MAG: hypothetical protein IJS47_01355 [Clostridia bacterium]|nr:hypothetical protein [Clostridia bacterium]